MRVSSQWLAELVEDLPPIEELARRLTMGGIEVEAVVAPERLYGDGLVVARIAEMEQHPNADRLTVCRVDDGTEGLRNIVCGARNMKAGDNVVLARPGCELPGGVHIKKAKLRGVESEGMLCSATELGLAERGEGILILEADLKAGTPAGVLLGLEDTILELGITPNRGDCLSVIGLAREVAAVCGTRLREAAVVSAAELGHCSVPVVIEDEAGCPVYHGLVVRGVRVGPSPTWLRTRLASCGLRSVSNVVDITNLVLIERGQPLHAFDLARLAGPGITVRRARDGEKIRTLDGRDVSLFADDLVIADRSGPVAIAGVMGGEATAVGESTVDVFLEAALFAPPAVRRTSRRHGLVTDSSYRFERGVDANGVAVALERAASLLESLAGGTREGGAVRVGTGLPEREPVLVRPSRLNAVVGQHWSDAEIEAVLQRIDSSPEPVDGGFLVTAPSYRQDLDREVDFFEEVARVVGYDSIAPSMPTASMPAIAVPDGVRAAGELRRLLSGLGLHEHVSVSFASSEDNVRFPGLVTEGESIVVRNPLRSDATELRRSAFGALLSALSANVAVQEPRVDLFSIARVFTRASNGEVAQKEVLAGLLYGRRRGARPGEVRELCFADARAVVEKALGVLAPATPVGFVAATDRPDLHPRASADVLVDGNRVGVLGRLHPDIAEDLEIAGEIYVFEVDCREAVEYRRAHPGLRPIPRYPSSKRDVSFLVEASLPAAAGFLAVEEMNESAIESIAVFDEYTGAGIESGRKALGYTIVYRAADRTLTDAEVTALHDRVIGHLTGRLQARVRV